MTRTQVTEWRLTLRVGWSYIVRLWVESDPEFGGMSEDNAYRHANVVKVDVEAGTMRWGGHNSIAQAFLDRFPAVNSVEVCNEDGEGCVMHRNWP